MLCVPLCLLGVVFCLLGVLASLFGEVGTFGDFVGGMRSFTARYDGGRKVYSWIVGKPLLLGQDREMFALAANSSPGIMLTKRLARSS